MSLRTYGPHEPIVHTDAPPGRTGDLKPSDWVTHADYGGKGIIVGRANDELTVLWSEAPRVPTFSLPNVRHVSVQPIAKQVVQAQPMTAPAGGIFYLDYKYGRPHIVELAVGTSGSWVSRIWRRFIR